MTTDLSRSAIYRIVHLASGNEYIGSSIDYRVRWRAHHNELARGTHHSQRLQHTYNKYGPQAFRFEILEFVADVTRLIEREQFFIDSRHPAFNMRPIAGSNLGHHHSAESCLRNRLAHLGRHHTAETCARMSRSRLGKALSLQAREHIAAGARARYARPEEREKARLLSRGRTLTPERRRKLMDARMAWLATPESRETLRRNAQKQFSDPLARHAAGNGNRGRVQSAEEIAKRAASVRVTMATPEYKAKASAVRKGRPKSPETRAKMSTSQRKRLANPELRARIAENTRQQHRRQKAAQAQIAPRQPSLWE